MVGRTLALRYGPPMAPNRWDGGAWVLAQLASHQH